MQMLQHNIPALVIGSTAAKYWWPTFRQPRDYDVYCDESLFIRLSTAGFSAQRATSGNGIGIILDESRFNHLAAFNSLTLPIATPTQLLAIKLIHINYPRKWVKNMNDYLALQKLVENQQINQEFVDIRLKFLDRVTKIIRTIETPNGFWSFDFNRQLLSLQTYTMQSWCIYAKEYRLRRFVQEHFREILNAQIRQ